MGCRLISVAYFMLNFHQMHRFPYKWTLKDYDFAKNKGSVFSCFSCGGGSTMGYKLAGFDVIGNNEIDYKMNSCYIENNNPIFNFLMPIQDFKNLNSFPIELYNLDILDGSPPCSSFSMSGSREDDWGKEKVFREGQQLQILDTLFFDFIDLGKTLQPKIIIAENVKGLMFGKAISYCHKIYKKLDEAGYICNHFLLDSSRMGVPQKRERIFFIALRKDLVRYVDCVTLTGQLNINLNFNEKKIPYIDIFDEDGKELTIHQREMWDAKIDSDKSFSDINKRLHGKINEFNRVFAKRNNVLPTLNSSCEMVDFEKPMLVSKKSLILASTFPVDYNFLNQKVEYLTGMSVPPVMTAQIASQVYEQLLSNINRQYTQFSLF